MSTLYDRSVVSLLRFSFFYLKKTPTFRLEFFILIYRLNQIVLIKRVSALGTELGGISGIGRFPAALVAPVLLRCGWLGLSAFCAEFARIGLAARAGPLCGNNGSRCSALLGGTAVSAELTRVLSAAGTCPRLGLLIAANGAICACIVSSA